MYLMLSTPEVGERRSWQIACSGHFVTGLLNEVRLYKAYTEFGRNLKPILPANKFKPLTPCVEPNQEIQLNFCRTQLRGPE